LPTVPKLELVAIAGQEGEGHFAVLLRARKQQRERKKGTADQESRENGGGEIRQRTRGVKTITAKNFSAGGNKTLKKKSPTPRKRKKLDQPGKRGTRNYRGTPRKEENGSL